MQRLTTLTPNDLVLSTVTLSFCLSLTLFPTQTLSADNPLTNDGVRPIVSALRTNSTLRELGLSGMHRDGETTERHQTQKLGVTNRDKH